VTLTVVLVLFGAPVGVVESGTHVSLLAASGLYAGLYREQFGGGLVECRTADGVRLANGTVVPLHE
jgi:ATP-binding cassette, subfamily B, bacterial